MVVGISSDVGGIVFRINVCYRNYEVRFYEFGIFDCNFGDLLIVLMLFGSSWRNCCGRNVYILFFVFMIVFFLLGDFLEGGIWFGCNFELGIMWFNSV